MKRCGLSLITCILSLEQIKRSFSRLSTTWIWRMINRYCLARKWTWKACPEMDLTVSLTYLRLILKKVWLIHTRRDQSNSKHLHRIVDLVKVGNSRIVKDQRTHMLILRKSTQIASSQKQSLNIQPVSNHNPDVCQKADHFHMEDSQAKVKSTSQSKLFLQSKEVQSSSLHPYWKSHSQKVPYQEANQSSLEVDHLKEQEI